MHFQIVVENIQARKFLTKLFENLL